MPERVAAVDEALGPRGPGQLRCDCVEARDEHPGGVRPPEGRCRAPAPQLSLSISLRKRVVLAGGSAWMHRRSMTAI
jgi:hypothetical protein